METERSPVVSVLALVAVLALGAAGCGARCAEIAAHQRALVARSRSAAGPDAQVRVPLARANALLAAVVHERPLSTELAPPALTRLLLPLEPLTATVRDVELLPSPAERLRFAIRLDLADPQLPITSLVIVAEVKPELVRTPQSTELVAGLGPHSVLSAKVELAPDSGRAIANAVARWLPSAIRDRVPRDRIDAAAQLLASYLTSEAYPLLRDTLLRPLGELTRLRLQLPALPITAIALAPTTDTLTVDLTTDLPVRGGLTASPSASDDVVVRISGSTAAELANWSIDHGHLPRHYTRDLEPRLDGEYRPRFDYLADDPRRPIKIHIFQERGGCSYFQVGLALRVAVTGDKLDVAVLDRFVESVNASAPLELALGFKQLVQGSIDSSRRAAAHTRLTVGDRAFAARVVHAAIASHELALGLSLALDPLAPATSTSSAAPAASASSIASAASIAPRTIAR